MTDIELRIQWNAAVAPLGACWRRVGGRLADPRLGSAMATDRNHRLRFLGKPPTTTTAVGAVAGAGAVCG